MAVNYNKMTMAQLKAELGKRSLVISGKKSELVARLDENDKLVKDQEEAEKKAELEKKKAEIEQKKLEAQEKAAKEKEAAEEKRKQEAAKKQIAEKEKEEQKQVESENKDKKEVIKEITVDTEEKMDVPKETTDAGKEEEEAIKKEVEQEEPVAERCQDEKETTTEVKTEIQEKMETEETKETEVGSGEKVPEKDAIDIINQIDDLISEDTTNNEVEAKKEEVKKEEVKETTDEEDKKEKDDKEHTESNGEKDGEETKEETEEKPEEPKVILKKDDYDFTKSATGFVVALDNGKNIVIPVKDMLKIDMKSRRQSKTVLAYPLSIEDLTSGILNPFIEKCCHLNISFHEHSHERQKSTKGYAELVFATDEEAQEQADLMAEINDDLVVRQLSRKDKPNNTYNEIPQELITVNNMLKKYIYIGNLPSTATEEELQALFPESNNLAVIVNNDGLPKGYALAELPTAEAVDEAIKKSMKINYPEYENKLLILRPWSKIPKGMLDSSTRRDLLDKIRNLRKLRMKCTDDIVRNRLENDMAVMKMKLDKDCKARDEVGLPVPPDIVRLEEAKAAKRESEKTKDKTGSNISTIQRGYKSVRRGGLGGATISTAGSFGNNQGFKKPFQSQGLGRGGFSGRQNYRGGSQSFRGGSPGFRRGGSNQGFRASNQGYQSGMGQSYQGGSGNFGAKQGGYGGSGSYGSGYGGSYDNKQSYGGSYGAKQGYGASQPGVNNAVEMLMQVSKMLGTNQKTGGGGYGSQGYSGNQSSNYSTNKYANQGNYGSQSGSYGNSYNSRGGGFSGGYKRRGDDAGYGGGGKRNTGYYNQNRW